MAIKSAANVFLVLVGNFSAESYRLAYLWPNYPPQAHYRISEADLDDYRTAHAPKAWGYPYKPNITRDL
jgi:hypothetical protein